MKPGVPCHIVHILEIDPTHQPDSSGIVVQRIFFQGGVQAFKRPTISRILDAKLRWFSVVVHCNFKFNCVSIDQGRPCSPFLPLRQFDLRRQFPHVLKINVAHQLDYSGVVVQRIFFQGGVQPCKSLTISRVLDAKLRFSVVVHNNFRFNCVSFGQGPSRSPFWTRREFGSTRRNVFVHVPEKLLTHQADNSGIVVFGIFLQGGVQPFKGPTISGILDGKLRWFSVVVHIGHCFLAFIIVFAIGFNCDHVATISMIEKPA
jgi:hypothetical protein